MHTLSIYLLPAMKNQETNVNTLRKELQDLAFINALELGPITRKAIHEQLLAKAIQLKMEIDLIPTLDSTN